MSWRPRQEQIEIAIEWLRCNEGAEGGEREACELVAGWLERELSERKIKNAARKLGVTPARLRAKLAEKQIEL